MFGILTYKKTRLLMDIHQGRPCVLNQDLVQAGFQFHAYLLRGALPKIKKAGIYTVINSSELDSVKNTPNAPRKRLGIFYVNKLPDLVEFLSDTGREHVASLTYREGKAEKKETKKDFFRPVPAELDSFFSASEGDPWLKSLKHIEERLAQVKGVSSLEIQLGQVLGKLPAYLLSNVMMSIITELGSFSSSVEAVHTLNPRLEFAEHPMSEKTLKDLLDYIHTMV